MNTKDLDENQPASKEISSTVEIRPESLTDTKLLLRVLQRDINKIGSDDVITRKRALSSLQSMIFEKSQGIDDEGIQTLFDELYKPLLKRLLDPSEKCREIATEMLTSFATRCPDLGPFLPYLFPVLAERGSDSFILDFNANEIIRDVQAYQDKQRGKSIALPDAGSEFTHEIAEPSEEIRLLLCNLLGAVVSSLMSRGLHSMLGPYFHDTVMFFHLAAVDPFPTLRIAGLQWIEKLASEQRLSNTMHHYCTALVRSLMFSLRHRHSKVRIAAIHCIKALVSCPYLNKQKGAGTDAIVDLVGYREDNVIPICAFYQGETRLNFFGFLLSDENPAVRLEFYRMIGSWMTTLLDRWDHASRLMPFLLAALTDASHDAQKEGLAFVNELGKQYEEEHAAEILEKRQYGVDGAQAIANYEDPLPEPWFKRPSVGARLFVRSHTNRFLNTVLRELVDWKSTTKKHAIGLLLSILVYTEEQCIMELHELLDALVMNAFDPDIEHNVYEIATILGRYVDPDAYLQYLLPHVLGEEGSISVVADAQWTARARALCILSAMALGSKPSRLLVQLTRLVESLSSQDMIRANQAHQQISKYFRALVDCIVTRISGDGGRAAVDAHFVATGRLHSLERQFESLYLLGLYLNDSTICQRMSQMMKRDAWYVLKDHMETGPDVLLTWDSVHNFIGMNQILEEERVVVIFNFVRNGIVDKVFAKYHLQMIDLVLLIQKYPNIEALRVDGAGIVEETTMDIALRFQKLSNNIAVVDAWMMLFLTVQEFVKAEETLELARNISTQLKK